MPATLPPITRTPDERVNWVSSIPFLLVHVACFAVYFTGITTTSLVLLAVMFFGRSFFVTAAYHRYFSHKAYRLNRFWQFVFAFQAEASAQKGVLWWAANHRHHHRNSDTDLDVHSPRRGFWRSHVGWFLTPRCFATDQAAVQDLAKFPELRLLDRFDILVPVLLAAGLYAVGVWLGDHRPALHTTGPQMLVWGFFISTVVLFHVTVTINSLAHLWGSRRFATNDDSRNNWLLAVLTFGEGWHNNHHHFPGAARQGFRWWEVDVTFYVLRAMALVGLVWDLKAMPASVRDSRRLAR